MSLYRKYLIKQGDTIQNVAFIMLNDIDRWTDIVTLNDLEYPYIVQTNEDRINNPEHLRTVGDTLLIPNDSANIIDIEKRNLTLANKGKIANDYYDMTMGMDLYLDVSDGNRKEFIGQLVNDNKNDIAVVKGIDNLRQSLILRLLTRKGTLYRHPEYGSTIPNILGELIKETTLQDAVTEFKRCITTDERVSKVSVTESEVTGNSIYIEAEISPLSKDAAFSLFIYRAEDGKITIK